MSEKNRVSLSLLEVPNFALLQFPQNVPPKITEQNNFKLLINENDQITNPKARKAIKISSDLITWVGKSDQSDIPQPKFFLGYFDSKKSMSLSPCLIKTSMQQNITKQTTVSSTIKNEEQRLSHFEMQRILAEELGTSKSKRKMRALVTNRVKQENISQAQEMEDLFKQKKEEIEDKIAEEDQLHRREEIKIKQDLLPAFSLKEKEISKIFDLKSIISDDEMAIIDANKFWISLTKKQDKIENICKSLGQYARGYLINFEKIFPQKSKSQKILLLKEIIYLDYMLKFLTRNSFIGKSINEIAIEMNLPDTIVSQILLRFYQGTKQNVSDLYQ